MINNRKIIYHNIFSRIVDLNYKNSVLCIFALLLFVMYSCNSEENPIKVKSLDIVSSDDFEDFVVNSDLAMDKFVSYTRTLTQDEFDELMYNLNNDDYMTEVINKAGIEKELQQIVESKEKLLSNKNYVALNESEQFTLFFDYTNPLQKKNVKTRSEGDQLNECQQRQLEDYAWARATCDIAIAVCTCAVELPFVACACYLAALANYANDIRLADRSYEDCIRNLN